ncbi:calmodulin-like isoform X2 [Mizuhopecten yessoensis]|nr:calmodulin-like isoform X2 [Mizuhopecten yessoensis]
MSQEVVDEKRECLRLSFNHFDKDGSGTITVDEIGKLFQALGQNPTNEQIEHMIKEADTDNSGSINFVEFEKYVNRQKECNQTKKQQEDDLKSAFAIMDRNGNGFISKKELRKVVKCCGERLSDEEIEEMMSIADTDEDGKID